VGAPQVGDLRIRLKPRRVSGRRVVPLTRPGEVQAWKIVIPACPNWSYPSPTLLCIAATPTESTPGKVR
jgi:hypothetical protein